MNYFYGQVRWWFEEDKDNVIGYPIARSDHYCYRNREGKTYVSPKGEPNLPLIFQV